MNIPTEFKGKVYFYWHAKYGGISASTYAGLGGSYTLVGETEDLLVKFADPRPAMVESIKASIEQERAESQRRIAIMQGRIQELLALECDA